MHYHLDVIPTHYIEGGAIETYQYIHQFNDAVTDELPAVYFQYNIGGVAVEIKPDWQPWYTFLM